MRGQARVSSAFADVGGFVEALKRLKEAGLRDLEAYSPVGMPELEHLLPRRGSPIRFIALAAGITGCVLGFWMCIGSAELYNLVVGGKHPVALLPYAIVGFEATVLISGVTSLIAILAFSRLRPRKPSEGYDPRYSVDHFGICVYCGKDQAASVADLLRGAGAEDVSEQRPPDNQ